MAKSEARPSSARAPLVPEQTTTGLVAALALALIDGVQAAVRAQDFEVGAAEIAGSVTHLVALYLPLGLLLGLLASALIAMLRGFDALTELRTRLGDPRRILRRDPRALAVAVGGLAGLALLAGGTQYLHALLSTRMHRADLLAWALSGCVVGLALAGFVLASLVTGLVRPVANRLGVLSVPAIWMTAAAVLALVAGVLVLRAQESLVQAYGWTPILFGPVALVVYLGSFGLVREVWRRRGPNGRAALAWWVASLLVATLPWVVSGLTYGGSNRIRNVVEQRSVVGRFLVRRYASLADLDGDGHASAFGGRDCDDFDADVHPGALDVPGDGVDSDCFYGDGSPSIHDIGDGRYGTPPAELRERPNVLLITVDALRPDHLGAAGYARSITPNLDDFAAEGVRFEQVTAQSSRSIRSVPAMMTGRYPSQIAYGDEYLFPALRDENHTVAELLRDDGYQTAAVMGTDYFQRAAGFFQGFEQVHQVDTYKPAREVTVNRALSQLRALANGRDPFFQWTHLFHVHQPYLDPPIASLYGPNLIDRYDTEVQLCDAEIGRLIDELDRLGVADDTVVIIASDHGESFGEHGRFYHSTDLYEEQVQSVLIIRVPGLPPRVVPTSVALFDVGATILNLAGVAVGEPTPARSLLPLMNGEPERGPIRPIISELMPDGKYPLDMKSLRMGDRKLIWWVQEGRVQYFDLSADPYERNDLSDEREADALEMLGLLQAWVAETNRPENQNEAYIARHLLDRAPGSYTQPLGLRYPGMFTVLGCDVPRTEYRIGETIDLTCFYEVQETTDFDLYFRLSFTSPGFHPPRDFTGNHFPLHGRYRTTAWEPGQIIQDPIPIVVPPSLTPPLEVSLTLDIGPQNAPAIPYHRGTSTARTATIATIRILEDEPREGAAPPSATQDMRPEEP